jgi:hypothetical protein
MSEEAPMSNDVEMPGSIVVSAQDSPMTAAELEAAMSNPVGTPSSVVDNESMPVARVGGEGEEAGREEDEEGLKWMDEGFVERVELSAQVDSALYADYFDTFGNVRTRTTFSILFMILPAEEGHRATIFERREAGHGNDEGCMYKMSTVCQNSQTSCFSEHLVLSARSGY